MDRQADGQTVKKPRDIETQKERKKGNNIFHRKQAHLLHLVQMALGVNVI
jgi:hypothetical protein